MAIILPNHEFLGQSSESKPEDEEEKEKAMDEMEAQALREPVGVSWCVPFSRWSYSSLDH